MGRVGAGEKVRDSGEGGNIRDSGEVGTLGTVGRVGIVMGGAMRLPLHCCGLRMYTVCLNLLLLIIQYQLEKCFPPLSSFSMVLRYTRTKVSR